MRIRAGSTLDRTPAWAMALALALGVAMVCLSMPYAVGWVWPGVDPVVLVLGNLFLGMILGSAAVIAFMAWRWREDSR
ncbi:hypothetical protein ACFQ6Q_00070 [Streptomyces sp. NPDC056437]|uniref:hypothetical protein n=1 Tax=Streptomyces sp. NPDC056437 TaxID=3345816 RepID=UPI0036B1CB39